MAGLAISRDTGRLSSSVAKECHSEARLSQTAKMASPGGSKLHKLHWIVLQAATRELLQQLTILQVMIETGFWPVRHQEASRCIGNIQLFIELKYLSDSLLAGGINEAVLASKTSVSSAS